MRPTKGREEMPTGFWCGNMKKGGFLEDRGVDGRITLQWVLNE
jgi:hypothetical protein